jgi:hypothetical protein
LFSSAAAAADAALLVYEAIQQELVRSINLRHMSKSKTPALPLPSVEWHTSHRLSARGTLVMRQHFSWIVQLSTVPIKCERLFLGVSQLRDGQFPTIRSYLVWSRLVN